MCKRFRALCLTPSLLTSISVRAGADPLPRYRALLTFLAAHATAVHHLELRSYSQTNEEAVAAAVTSCLAACGAAGRLEELTVGLWTPQGSVETWLPQLTSLRRLRLGTVARPLHLPPGVSRLEALLDAELTGCPLHLGHARLPPALTKLVLRDMASTQLPHQVGALRRLWLLGCTGSQTVVGVGHRLFCCGLPHQCRSPHPLLPAAVAAGGFGEPGGAPGAGAAGCAVRAWCPRPAAVVGCLATLAAC